VLVVWPNLRAMGRAGAALLALRISACSAFMRLALTLTMAMAVGAIQRCVRGGRTDDTGEQ
jgi:hypothetical protein